MNTEFFTKPIKKHAGKAIGATGTGLSVAVVIWCYQTFATKSDLDRTRETQRTLWQHVNNLEQSNLELRQEVEALKQQHNKR